MYEDSKYLAHFTKGKDAYHRLISILEDRSIRAGELPWTGKPAVCLTECPWSSLLDHVRNYSPYGIGFTKPHVFAAGGGPAYYVRADHYEAQHWEDRIHTFVTPFWPAYRPDGLKTDQFLKGKTVDYAHEREWRVPHNLDFDRQRIAFIVLDSYEDMARFPKHLKDDIGRDRFLLMDVYRKIEELWPTHILNRERS